MNNAKEPAMSSPPSFLVFCVDQMQAACLGCAGHPEVKTPNLDRLAARGTRFARAYCENPLCTPSRLSIFTGMSSRQHGVTTLGRLLPESTPTVVSAMRDAGYRTHACGKLHLQPWGLEYQRQHHTEKLNGLFSHEDEWFWPEGKISAIPEGYFGFEACDFVGGHADYISGDYMNWLDREHPEWGKRLRAEFRNAAWAYRRTPEAELTPPRIGKSYRMEIPPEWHYNHWIADRSVDFLESLTEDERFFLWCSFPDPHHPFAATRPYSEMYDPASLTLPATWNQPVDEKTGLRDVPRQAHGLPLDQFNEAGLREMLAQTYGMITHVDDCIGRVLDQLEASGRAENTEIVFMSDHGDYLGAHHLITKGLQPFEEIMRVPLIWVSPTAGPTAQGRVEENLVSLLDFAPTVLARAGLSLDAIKPRQHVFGRDLPWFDGESLAPNVVTGADLADRSFIAVKEDNSQSEEALREPYRAHCYYRGDYKLILTNVAGNKALFDLKKDPGETTNLWNDPEHAPVRADLLEAYALDSLSTEYAGVPRVSGP